MTTESKQTYGQIVAKRFKRQYFSKQVGWSVYDGWHPQPEQTYIILLELKSKEAINALLGNSSWTRYLPRKRQRKKL